MAEPHKGHVRLNLFMDAHMCSCLDSVQSLSYRGICALLLAPCFSRLGLLTLVPCESSTWSKPSLPYARHSM
jgi:hypothetical protein